VSAAPSPVAAPQGEPPVLAELRVENASLRRLARQMSAVPDTETLLRTLCDVVVSWCAADGAGVGQIEGDGGIVVTALGAGAPEVGQRFPLSGSVAERAIAAGTVVTDPDYATANPHMRAWAEENNVGELMVAPLFAGEQPIGLVNAYRKRGRDPFSPRDMDHLRVIADHAAVALAKVRLLEEAHAATVARSNFLAAVSHELRTPLTTLAGYGELLADDILGELTPAQHETIERMRSVTHQLSALIDEILTYSSLEAGCELVRAHDTTSEDIFAAAVAAIEPLARQKELRLTTHLPPIPTPMTTDAEKVRQILVNLLSNALKFTDEGGVDVSVEHRGAEVHFTIADTGIGIARADVPRLFQPFMQLDGGLTRRHGGTGLGLYISRRLAHLLGGRIDVESTPGIGSTFTLALPTRYARR
jgi:signal transduction histidine kinase